MFRKHGHLNIEAYTNADWAGIPNDKRSALGYFTLVRGNLVTWRSKKQKVVALSSVEAEFWGLAKGITKVYWIKKLITEIGFPPQLPSQLKCDNKATISNLENPVQHDKTNHIEVDKHFIKEKIADSSVELPFVRSEDQLAEILTKAITGKAFTRVLSKLRIGDPNAHLDRKC